jgi:hypothetical protein
MKRRRMRRRRNKRCGEKEKKILAHSKDLPRSAGKEAPRLTAWSRRDSKKQMGDRTEAFKRQG